MYVYPGDFERRGLVRGTGIDDGSYVADSALGTETQYVIAGARTVWKHDPVGSDYHRENRFTVGLTDLIQTTAAVMDVRTGELLETSTYYPNGARETCLVDSATATAPEVAGFTGKEGDEEVGVVYFGERYLIPRLGRWASPDPLHVHAVGGGEALNSFHYLSGRTISSRDLKGLVDVALAFDRPWATRARDRAVFRDNARFARQYGRRGDRNEDAGSTRSVVSSAPPRADVQRNADIASAWRRAASASAQNPGPHRIIALTGHGTDGSCQNGQCNPAAIDMGPGLRVTVDLITDVRRVDRGDASGLSETRMSQVTAFRQIRDAVRESRVDEVVFMVCRTGRSEAGRVLAQELAAELNARVTVPRDFVVSGTDNGTTRMWMQASQAQSARETTSREASSIPGEGDAERWYTFEPQTARGDHAPEGLPLDERPIEVPFDK